MFRRLEILKISLLILLLAACQFNGAEPAASDGSDRTSATGEETSSDLEGINWVLTAYGSKSAPTEALPGATAVFEDGVMRGSTGCNSYSTSYTISGREFGVGPIMATEMACLDPGIMEQEALFTSALGAASAYELTEGTLIIYHVRGMLHFEPEVPTTPLPLEGTVWQLQTLEEQSGDAVTGMPLPPGMNVTARFEDGQVSGETGCNSYGAAYQADGDRLTLDAMMQTDAVCGDELKDQFEGEVLGGLQKAESFITSDTHLIISFPGGRLFFQPEAEEQTRDVSADVEPPAATLTVNGVSQTSGIGTYCWAKENEDGTAVGLCADMIGIPTPPEPLVVEGAAEAILDLPVADAPSQLHATIRPVSMDEAMDADFDKYTWWEPFGGEEFSLGLESHQTFSIDLAPGLYLLSVQVWWDGLGDVVYGFLLEIR